MSELKAFDIVVAEEGYCEGIVKYRRAVYDKSEADKVIDKLKEQQRWRKCSEELPEEYVDVFVHRWKRILCNRYYVDITGL